MLNILVFCSSCIYFALILPFKILHLGIIDLDHWVLRCFGQVWVRTTRVAEVRNPPKVPWPEMEELGYLADLLGAGLGTAAWLTPVGIAEFSGMCFPSSRSGKRLKKTRKYDIITTPAERVEMAPLNEEDDEDEDSTVFDIKYRYWVGTVAFSWARWLGEVGRFTSEDSEWPGVYSCSLAKSLTLGHSASSGELL